MAFFSVIIPVYNKAHFLEETIHSVLNQSFKDFEIIIINDGSTDHSLDIINAFRDQRIKIFNQKNQGASAARNKGIELSNTSWIALLDADDIWFETHLEELHNGISKYNDIDLISNAYEILLQSNFIKIPNYSKAPLTEISKIENYFEYSLIDPLFWTSSIAFNKEVFWRLGGFDTSLKTGQDMDLIIQFALHSTMAYNPKITLQYRRHTENNLSSTVAISEKIKYIKKYKKEELANPSLKRYLDINRFSLSLQAKLNNNRSLYKEVKKDINPEYLSTKQKILLKCPTFILSTLKSLQVVLLKLGIYKSAFN